MNKKVISIIILFAFLLLMTSCVSEEEFNAIKKENIELKEKVSSLETEVDELENGAARMLGEIQNAFNRKEYDNVISLTELLVQRHPGSAEVKEAAILKDNASKILQDAAKREAEEKERQRQEALKSEKDKAREIIRVSRVFSSKPNSAGGVDFTIVWQNKSKKTIKYAYFTVEPYNAVGDVVQCSIGRDSRFTGMITGPINAGSWHGEGTYWENAWYNNTIRKVELVKVEIEYMDGTTAILEGENVDFVIY